MSGSEERSHCFRRACAIAEPGSALATRVTDAIERERQAAREPLEAQVRELENRLAMTEQRAGILEEMRVESLRETFDPQAVRELLRVIDRMQAGGAPIAGLLAPARRVRESEKK